MNSAIRAFATKNPPRIMNKRVCFCMDTSLQLTNFAAKRFVLHLLILGAGLSCCSAVCAQSATELLRQEIEQLALFETTIDTASTPGYIVGIIDGSNQVVLSFGTRGRRSLDTINGEDVFEVGSVSKVLTATLCAILSEQESIDISEDIGRYLPDEYTNSSGYEISLELLLSHMSGLPREPSVQDEMGDPLKTRFKVTPEDIMAEYRDLDHPANPAMLYSNVGYGLVEAALYGMTGTTYDELLNTHICDPQQMYHTGTTQPEITIDGYGLDGKLEEPCDYGYFSASGGVRSCLVDMMRFAKFSLTDAPRELFVKKGDGMNKYLGIGLGWHIVYPKGKFIVHMHTGRSPGHSAFIGMARQTGTAVVILSNSARGTDDLGIEILRIMNRNWKRKN